MMGIFKRKPKPHLIDLHKYEHECMKQKRLEIPLRPPPTIPGGSFTEEEMAIMRDNRISADEIYRGYK